MKKIDNLKTINNTILYLGILISIVIWIKLTYIQDPQYVYLEEKIFNLSGLILGFEVLIFSIFLWAFTSVYCGIAEDTKLSKKILEQKFKNE